MYFNLGIDVYPAKRIPVRKPSEVQTYHILVQGGRTQCAALGQRRMKIVTVNDMFACSWFPKLCRVTCSSVELRPLASLAFRRTSARLVNDLLLQTHSHTRCLHIGALPALWAHSTLGQWMLNIRWQLAQSRRRRRRCGRTEQMVPNVTGVPQHQNTICLLRWSL